jgi:predicted secreted protein
VLFRSNGTTITIKTGDSLRLTLKDFGDGGYSWSIKTQDARMLTLKSTDHSNSSGSLGDFGSNIWVFSALQPGSSSLELVCARPWNTTDVCATFNIHVVIQ